MSGRYIVLADRIRAPLQNRFTEYFSRRGWQYWHWIEGCWLLSGVPDGVGSDRILSSLLELARMDGALQYNPHFLVMKVEGDPKAVGFLPDQAAGWLVENWKLDDRADGPGAAHQAADPAGQSE